MAGEPEQEFELVLGNKQLFGILFIVLVLLAVFFAMGYVMGRNTVVPEIAAKPDTTAQSEPASVSGQRRSQLGSSQPSPTPAPSEQGTGAQTDASTVVTGRAAAPPKPEPSPIGAVADPQPGETYWQVSAVAKPEAEVLVEVLIGKGFHAIIAPGPSEKLFRVLVGPAKDPAELGRLRTDLEQAGFKPMVRKY